MKSFSPWCGIAILAGALLPACVSSHEKMSERESTASALVGPAKAVKVSRDKAASEDVVPGKLCSSGLVYYPNGVRDGAAFVIEKLVPDEVALGRPFDYVIRVTNLCATPLDGVIVHERLDENFTFVTSSPKASSGGEHTLAFELGLLSSGQTKTVTVSGSAAKPGVLTSTATLDYELPVRASIKVSAAGLSIATTMAPEASLCDAIRGRITVANPGTGVTKGIKVHDSLPEGLTTDDGKKSIDIDVGALKAGDSREFTFNLKAANPGQFSHKATATANNGLEAESEAVEVVVHQPVLSVKVECPAGTMMIGRQGTYTFTVQNTGDAPATNTAVVATIPSSMKFRSADSSGTASGERCTWNLGTLAPNESRTVTATYANAGPGVITARVIATANCAVEARDTCDTTVKGVANMGTSLTDNNGVVTVGDPQEYVCEVVNQGQLDLTNVKVVATWEDALDWGSSSFSPVPAATQGRAEFNVATVKVGEKRRFSFFLKASRSGEFKISIDTTATEMKNATHQDEITTFIDR
jgi:uncharacterized repeat protein (TIGR01451 family)